MVYQYIQASFLIQLLERKETSKGFHHEANSDFNCYRPPEWCIAVLETSLQTRVQTWAVSQLARDWESHRTAHNCPSVVRDRGGFGLYKSAIIVNKNLFLTDLPS
jgi:hypothetical protein